MQRLGSIAILLLLALSMVAFGLPEMSRPRNTGRQFVDMKHAAVTGQVVGTAQMANGITVVVDGDAGSVQLFDSSGRFVRGWWTPFMKAYPVLHVCSATQAFVVAESVAGAALLEVAQDHTVRLTPLGLPLDGSRWERCRLGSASARPFHLPIFVAVGTPLFGAIALGAAAVLGVCLHLYRARMGRSVDA